jgi:AraC-like DNA-binding protein
MPKQRAVTHRIVDGEILPSIPTLDEPRFSQSLERGLGILECFTPEQPVWGIAELADQLGMSRSTTHR